MKKRFAFHTSQETKSLSIMKPIIDVDSLNKELKNPKNISNRYACTLLEIFIFCPKIQL